VPGHISLAISDLSRIDQVFRRGGVPLQQVMSAMLTKAGQYLRRERSFEGVEFTPKPYAVEPEFAGRAAEAMREIVRFEAEVIGPIIAGIQAELAGEAALTGGDASQINSTNFTAMMHNVIDQMLLALKADAAAEDAIASLRAGEKTVIAVANTMGSLLGELVTLSNITPGERIDFSFRDVMLRYLDRTRWYSERDPHSPRPVRRYITDEELGEGLDVLESASLSLKDGGRLTPVASSAPTLEPVV